MTLDNLSMSTQDQMTFKRFYLLNGASYQIGVGAVRPRGLLFIYMNFKSPWELETIQIIQTTANIFNLKGGDKCILNQKYFWLRCPRVSLNY